jgi:GT2 family glycosyltransferase
MLTIGIPIRNALDYVKITLESVIKNTSCKFELILIDDCSDKETSDYIQQYKEYGKIIRNNKIKGFPYNCNMIISNASYDNICLLNSDVYCPAYWNEKIIKALEFYDIVGPSSCRVCGPQLIKEIEQFQKTWTIDEIEKYSIKISNKFGNEMMDIKIVGGFCFTLKKKVIEKIGMFDENYGLGSYEETDFCIRAIREGFKLGWVKGCYIHHYGHASFCNVNKVDDLWNKNKQILMKKYKLTASELNKYYL